MEDPGIVNGHKKFVQIEYILLLIFAAGFQTCIIVHL